jgi:ribonuclease VapC
VIAVDTSALIAVAVAEQEADAFNELLAQHRSFVGWPTLFETHMVLADRIGPFASRFVAELVGRPNIITVQFDEHLFALACNAFDQYGKGRPRRSRLNFGDCMSYAVAKFHDVPLLFKGNDFRLTDLRPALP